MVAVRLLAFAAGFAFAMATVLSAVRTVVVPRGERVRITGAVLALTRWLFELRAARVATFAHKDRILARLAPISLILLPGVWAVGILLGFVPMYWALGSDSWRDAVELSGSSLLTLGFERTDDLPTVVLSFVEALLGLGLVALLISYLPTIYGHFSRRQAQVAKLESRAGSPPTPMAMLIRAHSIGQLDNLHATWTEWEDWFIGLGESHASFPALCFFRSPQLDLSWIVSAGAVLDTASFTLSTVDVEASFRAPLTIRAGYLALRRIADFFDVEYDPSPRLDDPISIHRAEFDALCEDLRSAGLPLKHDLDQAWRDFVGWRVNYDAALRGLCGVVMPPVAPWSSDRAIDWGRSLPVFRSVRHPSAAADQA